MTPSSSQATEEARIRDLIESWAEAVRNKDSIGLMAHVAPDVLVFDLVTPLRYAGATALKKRAEEWLSSFQGPITYQVRDLNITAASDVAFCHSLNRVGGTNTSGDKIDMWWRATVCFRKVHGNWTVTHEHSSVPFDMATRTAALDLKP